MKFIKLTDYEKAKAIDMAGLLDGYNIHRKNNMYSCLFHEDKNPSSSIGKKNKLHCFSCRKTSSTIDVVMHLEGCDEHTAIRKLLGNNLEVQANKEVNREPTQEYKSKKDTQQLYEYVLSNCRPLSSQNYGYIIPYLNSREIRGMLDLLQNFRNNEEELEILHNYYEKKNYIVYHFPKYKFFIQKAVDRSAKRNFGIVRPAYFKMNESNIWYITEGIEDCFSLILAHKYNVVCLNSISNINKFTEAIKTKYNKDTHFIIAVDNDGNEEKGGVMAKNTLINFFTENNIKYDLYHKFYNYAEKYNLKDINECFIHKRRLNKCTKVN